MKRHLRWSGAAALAVVAGLVPAGAASASANAGTSPQAAGATATKAVSYHGYTFDVPSSWPVIDLATTPSACVSFAQHAVYLGAPSAKQQCEVAPSKQTDALLIEPSTAHVPASVIDNRVLDQVEAMAPGIKVTGSYHTYDTQISEIISHALPAAAANSALKPHANTLAPRTAAGSNPAPAINPLPPVGRSSVSYTGNAFDVCSAPTEAQMAAWKANSPYDAIGIYIGGENRQCAQPNLTAQWVHDEAAAGWHFFLLYTGPQAPGTVCKTCTTMSTTAPEDQAAAAATDAIDDAAALGFQPGTPIFYDLQDYADGGTNTTAVMNFLTDWSLDLSASTYMPGVHGTMDSAVTDLVANYSNTNYYMPVYLDFASGNGVQSTDDASIPAADWQYQQRINEYEIGQSQTYGGVTLTVDSDYMDILAQDYTLDVFATAADGSVMELLDGGQWLDLGGHATNVIVGLMNIYATFSNGQGIYYYDPGTGTWARIGGPGAQFAVVNDELYGLSTNRSAVYEFDWDYLVGDLPGTWRQVGTAASAIYGGLVGLVATNPSNSAAYFYAPTATGAKWEHIGGGGAQFAESDDTIYGLTPNRSGVYQWSGKGTAWTQVGGAAQNLYTDFAGTTGTQSLYASTSGNKALYAYLNTPGQWSQVGGAGAQFAVNWQVYGLNKVGGDVYEYEGTPIWQNIGGPFTAVYTHS